MVTAHRILHVINTAEVGGGAEHVLHLAQGLGAYGFQSFVAVGRDGPATERLRVAGIPATVVGPLGVTAPFALARLFKTVCADLVHLHGSRAGLVGVLAARAVGAQSIVYTAHAFAFKRRLPSLHHWAVARADALTCRLANRVICLSQQDAEAATRSGIAANHVVVIPNGVEIRRFTNRSDRRSEFGFGSSTPVVGMIARLVLQKDPLTFVRMAHYVADAVPDSRFLLVGDGELRRAVEREGLIRGLESRLVLTGFRTDVPELLATMDVVVLSSLWEGLPIVALEAMASAKPVVATAVSGLHDLLVDGQAGVLAPVQDPVRLADAVVRLLRHPESRRAMGVRARDRVAREFTLDRMVAKTAELYRIVLSAKDPARVAPTTLHSRGA